MTTPTQAWERHPADVARFVFSSAVTGVLILTAWAFDAPLTDASTEVVRLFSRIPDGFTLALVGIVQVVVTAGFVAVTATLVAKRRWRLLGLVLVAGAGAGVVTAVLAGLLDSDIPLELARTRRVESWVASGAYPPAALLAAGAAIVTATATFTTQVWHRIAWSALIGLSLLRVLTATEVPVNLVLILAVGSAMGSAALVAVGAPHRRIDVATISDTLAHAGLDVTEINAVGEQRSAPMFRVHTADGRDCHAVVLGRDQRDHDLLLRTWKTLRIKGFNERRPIASPRRSAEYETLVLALAQAAGVDAARPVALGVTSDEAAIVVSTWAEGTPLGQMDPSDITHELLVRVWMQVGGLAENRIAHRWLNADSVVVSSGVPTLVGFRWGTVSADDALLGADVVELLCSTSVLVGIERAVGAAMDGLGERRLAGALPLLQPLVIASETKESMKAGGVSITDLREAVRVAVGAEEIELVPLSRVSLRGIVSLVGGMVLAYYVLTLASDWRSIADAFGAMNWVAVVPLVGLVLVANVGGALALMGSVNIALPFMRTNQIQFAQGFLNRFTPANAGGMALRARYLQREGVEYSVGAAAVGLGSVASGVVQVVFIVVFLLWGGAAHELSRFQIPSTTRLLGMIVLVAAVVGAVSLSAWGKRVVVPTVKRATGPALASLAELARQPTKLAQLFGGAVLTKLAHIAALAVSTSALGIDMGFARLGAVYMVASTVGSAVPTPGGVGGIEAALTASLISAGVEPATAGAIVLVFRLFTFWLPTLPGWVCLQRAQRTGVV